MTTPFTLPYGKESVFLPFLADAAVDIYYPPDQTPIKNIFDEINYAIRNCQYFSELARYIGSSTRVSITINDKTRPVPNNLLFPPLLNVLEEYGVSRENITLIIATGTHKPMRAEEFNLLLDAEYREGLRMVSHDCDNQDNLVSKGNTRFGTPVYVNKIYDEADIKIVVGDIEPHHFAGFSGGSKSAAIGVCGRETITHNHNFLMDPRCKVGEYEENPLRQDIESIGELIGVDLALNAILNEKKEIIHVFFDRPLEVMKKGVAVYREHSLTKINHPYDLVVASAGGFPKDINLYQAQKALTHASMFCKDGGMVFLIAACDEGVGSQPYLDFMQGVSSHSESIARIKTNGFQVGPHKAYQFAMIAERIQFEVFSNIDASIMAQLKIIPITNLENRAKDFLSRFIGVPRIAVLPYATATIPQLQGGNNG